MRRTVLVAPVLTISLIVLLAGPAAAVPRDLRVSSATCNGVTVMGEGLPANEQLFLLVRNLATGAVVGGQPTPVQTTSDGTVSTRLPTSLKGVATVDVSIWTKKGETLTMAASDTVRTGCAAVKGSLALTGPAAVQAELVVGLLLLVAGTGAMWWARYRPRHASA
ncbi:MAG TPA: hypothetical protein VGS14_09700 [Actinomycetes bacterium]|jgi:hypothetical protein|nr:hypothetical protein [Actinomycetes bacterium]